MGFVAKQRLDIEHYLATGKNVVLDKGKMKCLDCGFETEILFSNPADPSAEEGDYLCSTCWESEAKDVIEELTGQINQIIKTARENSYISLDRLIGRSEST
jgi:hypothetical protein